MALPRVQYPSLNNLNTAIDGHVQPLVAGRSSEVIVAYSAVDASRIDDEFAAFLFGAATGFPVGGILDPLDPFSFFAIETGGNTVGFDLSTLCGRSLGLQFEPPGISFDWDDLCCPELVVANVRREDSSPVPEPSTVLLASARLLAIARATRRWESTLGC